MARLTNEIEALPESFKRLATQAASSVERKLEEALAACNSRVDSVQDLCKQEAVKGLKRAKLEESHDKVRLFEKQVKV